MPFFARSAVLCVALFFVGVAGDASAAFTLLEDFDSLNLGALDDRSGAGPNYRQGGWIDNGALGASGTDPSVHLATVALDPFFSFNGNHALRIDANAAGADTSVYKTLAAPIADGSTGTLFMRFYAESVTGIFGNLEIGSSRAAAPSAAADFAGYGVAEGLNKPPGTFQAGDGAARSDLTPLYSPGTWNNLWVVLDNANDQTQFYISRLNQTPILMTGAGSPFSFRNGQNAQDLLTMMVRSSNNGAAPFLLDGQYIDDIYVDTAGVNLTNPALVTTTFKGDYNNDKLVTQADLDLVLLNWGQSGTPGSWVRDFPNGIISQDELDGVLLNWGNVVPPPEEPGSVPEPGSAVLLVLGGFVLARRRRA